MKDTFRYILFSLLILISLSRAQTPTLYFKSLSTAHGLSSKEISNIYQDNRGFIWFSSIKGLDKYDGYNFQHYDFLKSIRDIAPKNSIYINKIVNLSDDSNVLLLATNIGLFYLPENSDSIDYYPKHQFKAKVNLRKILAINTDSIWVAQPTRLYRFDSKIDTLALYHFRNKKDKILQISKILRDGKNRIWVTAGPDLFLYNPNKDCFKHIPFNRNTKNQKKPNNITSIVLGEYEDLWILQDQVGLIRFNYDQYKVQVFSSLEFLIQRGPSHKISKMIFADDGNIWISTKGFGILKFDPTSEESVEYMRNTPFASGLEGNQIIDIFLDRSGVFWAAIEGYGLNLFSYSSTNFYQYVLQYPEYYKGKHKRIYSIYQDNQNTIWLGPVNFFGIFSLNPATGKTRFHPYTTDLKNGSISTTYNSISEASNTELWVTSLDGGLSKFNKITDGFRPIINDLDEGTNVEKFKIYIGFHDSNGYLWLNSGKHWVYRYESDKANLQKIVFGTPQQKGKEIIRSFFETENGQILFGSSRGNVFVYDAQSDKLELYFTIKFNNKTLHIRGLAEDSKGDLWIATGRGLFVYHKRSGQIEHFTQDDGLYSQNLSTLVIDNYGSLWTSHNRGISRFDTGLRKFTNFSHQSGLYSSNYSQNSSFRAGNGNLLFGNLNGCTVVSPKPEIQFPDAPIRITSIVVQSTVLSEERTKTLQNSLVSGQKVKLPYDNYGFTFDFSLLDYKEPLRNKYAYKLIGQSDEWQNIGNKHSLSFVGLPAGEYTFCVKGKSATGNWSTDEIAIDFSIQIPFWKSWWFYTWLLIIFLLVFFTIYRVRVYAVRLRNKELEEINRKLNDQIDIRRQVEQMLTENEIKYRTLVEGIGDGIFTMDANGIFYFLNNTAASRIGGVPEDFTGKSVYDYYPTEIADPLVDRVQQVLADGQSRELNAQIPQNGKSFDYNVSLHPLKNDRGENTLALSIAVDTSEKKALENQLRQSQKMEAIGNLAGGIAHDFNNLLSVIRGYSYLLLADEKPGDPLYESLREIDSAGKRAQGLTRQLLAFSRKQLLEPKVINLNTRIRDTNKMLRRLIRENIEIDMQLAEDLNHIFADPGQLEQVIMNLVLNAGDAMPLGGKLTIQTRNSDAPEKLEGLIQHFESSAYAELSISDSGIGMDKETQSKIFDPFYTKKEKGKGTGLGLSTVFGIVKQSDGFIWVDSEPGNGSTFTVYFPSVDKQTIAEELAVPERKELRGSETILVVEDEASVRLMIVKMLKLYGYKTFVAADGQDGIKCFNEKQTEIDLILSDVVMPDMSGVEMMQEILKKNPLSRYVLMSGYTDEEIVRHGIVDRGINFIQKPFTPDALMGKIRKTLDSEAHLSSD